MAVVGRCESASHPPLLGTLQSQDRELKPSLVHRDRWDIIPITSRGYWALCNLKPAI